MSEGLAALSSAVPAWLALAIHPLLAFFASFLATRVALSQALGPFRAVGVHEHWTERAREALPARVVSARAPPVAGLVFLIVTLVALVGAGTTVMRFVAMAAGIAAFLGSTLGTWPVAGVLGLPDLALRAHLSGRLFTSLVRYPHALVVIAFALWMPTDPRVVAVLSVFLGVLLFAVGQSGQLRLAESLGLIGAPDARLSALVARTAARMGHRQPSRVWIARWPVVNALAFPVTGELAFTERALAQLTDPELEAVTAHELGHLAEPQRVVRMRVLGIYAIAPLAWIVPISYGATNVGGWQFGLIAGLVVVAGSVVLLRAVGATARRMEERADAIAQHHETEDGAYARSLERIYELNLLPAVDGPQRSAHPHLYDRLVSAGLVPTYPRPQPPTRARSRNALIVLNALLVLSAIAVGYASSSASARDQPAFTKF